MDDYLIACTELLTHCFFVCWRVGLCFLCLESWLQHVLAESPYHP